MDRTVEIWNADITVLQETYTDSLGTLPDEEMIVTGLRYDIYAGMGMGSCSFILHQDVSTVTVSIGDVLKIKDNAGTVQWIGMIVGAAANYNDRMIYEDEIAISAVGEIFRADEIQWTLQADATDGSDKTVSTNTAAIFRDIFDGSQFTSTQSPNRYPLGNAATTNITYSAANNPLTSVSVDANYPGANAYDAALEQIRVVNGNRDLNAVEKFIWYVDRTNTIYTKVRETSLLATYDIGPESTKDNFLLDSVDLELDGLTEMPPDRAGIKNAFIVNGTVVSSSQYATEETDSRTAYGIRPIYIRDPEVSLSQTTAFWDGINKGLFEPLTGYVIKLKKETYGFAPVYFAAPDGYIKLTKDSGGSTYAELPFKRIIYIEDSGGYDHIIEMGDSRPNINTMRLKTQENENVASIDTTPPNINAITSSPVSVDKKYTQTDSNFYLAANASDDVGVTGVVFYLSKLTIATNTWGAWINLGSGALQSAPDAESQDYWQLSTGSGFKDLTAVPASLVAGDVFKIKYTATDAAGNKASVENEYQLSLDGYVIADEIVLPDTPNNWDTPDKRDMEAGTTFKWKFGISDRSVNTVVVTRTTTGATPVAVTGAFSTVDSQYIWESDDITVPAKGKIMLLQATITDLFLKVYKKAKYVKGIERQAIGAPCTVTDTTAGIDDEDLNVTQFKTNVRFDGYWKEQGYLLKNTSAAPDVEFRIYAAGSATPDLTIKTDNTLEPTEDGGAGSGKFYWSGTVATLLANGLSPGIHNATFAFKRTEDFLDLLGAEQTDTGLTIEEGPKTPFELVGSTLRTRLLATDGNVTLNETDIATHETRLPGAEQELNIAWVDDASDPWTQQVKFYAGSTADPAPDAGGPGVFWTPKLGTTTAIRLSADLTGTPEATFTLNNDGSAGQYILLEFESDATTGLFRYDKTNEKFEINPDGGGYVDLVTGTSNLIKDTYNADDYELKVNSANGDLTYTQIDDPGGTPSSTIIFKVDGTTGSVGIVTIYNDLLPDADTSWLNGDTGTRWLETHSEEVHAKDVIFTNDGTTQKGSLTYDVTLDAILPTGFLIGFKN